MLRKPFKPHSIVVAILALYKYQFYRKWWGGHWELWWVDFPICSEIWHDVEKSSTETGERPYPLLRGTPVCEQYEGA